MGIEEESAKLHDANVHEAVAEWMKEPDCHFTFRLSPEVLFYMVSQLQLCQRAPQIDGLPKQSYGGIH